MAVVVAIVFSVVFCGLSVLVLDVGSLYAEKRQLQNGADAGALAVIEACAKSGGVCDQTASNATAASFANNNSLDSTSNVDQVCGTAAGLNPCTAPSPSGPWDCRAPSGTAKYAQVYTSTRLSNGLTQMRPLLARVLPGMGGYTGTTVRACARAAIGNPSGLGSAIPITISECEWSADTANGTNFATPLPPYPPYPASGYEKMLIFHNPGNLTGPNACQATTSGSDLPGGFGWLYPDTSTSCTTSTVNGWVPANPGNSGQGNGQNLINCIYTAWSAHQVIYVPIYDMESGTGNNGTYRLAGYGAFYISGYKLANGSPQGIPGGEPPVYSALSACPANTSCIWGFWLKTLVSGTPSSSGGQYNFGATVIGLTG